MAAIFRKWRTSTIFVFCPFSRETSLRSWRSRGAGEKDRWGLFKHGNIPFYWVKVGPYREKHETRVWDRVTSLVVQNTRALHNKQPSDWEFQKNFKISPKKQQEILPPPLFPTARTSLEDWPPRKGDFSTRHFVVELFALVGTAPSMSLLLTDISFWVVASKIKPS